LLPNLEKALYLDVDIVVSGNIRELWKKDISDYSLAAVQDSILSYNIVKDYIGYDYYQEGYINSGVLLINLAYWREHNIQQKLTDYLNTHSVKLPDQDAINAILHGTIKFIHPRWNAQASYFTLPPRVVLSQKKYIKKLWKEAIIIHFTGPFKAWYRECANPYKHLYEKYLDFTPWKRTPSLYLKSWFEGNIFIFLCYIRNMMAYLCSWFYN
jgi:lipopolysaccharide biosynthesis glycosyltransferase